MKAFGITIISLALTTAVIGNAYYQKKQFYPSVVYITKSNPSMAVSNFIIDNICGYPLLHTLYIFAYHYR